jgi:hypothetical protein
MGIFNMDNGTIVGVDRIKNIDWNLQKQRRSGVVVYTTYKKENSLKPELMFLLGIDTQSGNITDFGGGIKSRRESPLKGGLREFQEESLGIFGNIIENELDEQIVIYTDQNMIIFIHIDFDIDDTMLEFNKRVSIIKDVEVNSIILMTEIQFVTLLEGSTLNNRIMYTKVREILAPALKEGNFIKLL